MRKAKAGKRKELGKVNKRPKLIIAALAVFILAGVSLTVYSKYYKTGYNKGMAIASGFYFGSSFMTELDGEDEKNAEMIEKIKSIDDLLSQPEIIKKLPVKANGGVWTGSAFQCDIDINNYANQLLYNDQDLNVSYTVEFALLDEPRGAEYKVRKGDKGEYTLLENIAGASVAVSFTGQLEGGRLNWDTYQLTVSMKESAVYNNARILVLAYPTAPSYLIGTKKLAGIIEASYKEEEMVITDQGFTVEDNLTKDDLSGDGWKEKVKEESALVYQIKTTGKYFGEGQPGQKQKIKISWDREMYELNNYDKYRTELGNKYEGDATGVMVIETMPYASINFVFFKKENFDSKVHAMSSFGQFEETVQAEMLQ